MRIYIIGGEKFQQMPKCRDAVEIINLETETTSKNSRPRLGTWKSVDYAEHFFKSSKHV